MPCVALNQNKVHRAYRARRRDRKIRDTQPVGSVDKMTPETAELVKAAAMAVEVAAPIATKKSTRQARKAAKLAAKKSKTPGNKLTRALKKLKTASLRRSAVKAARTTKSSLTSDTKKSPEKASTETSKTSSKASPKPSSPAIRLKDGDLIQIRERRPRAATSITANTKAGTKATTVESVAVPTTEVATSSSMKTAAKLVAEPASISTPKAQTAKKSQKAKKSEKTLKNKKTKQTKKAKKAKQIQPQSPIPAALSPATARALKKGIKASTKPRRRARFRRPSRAELINAESRLGSLIFGPIPAGHRREFFHDRENIWIWHESWTDSDHHARQLTIRYEARPSGVYKKVSAGKYFKLEGAELENFRKATRAYLSLIKQHIYNVA